VRFGSIAKASVVAAVLLLAGCHSGPPRAPAKGEAYVGPATLNLRSDIPTQSSTVATVKHGDRLEILEQRRSFLKVRAPNGAVGWIEQRQLLGADDMAGLKTLAASAATMPSQGKATTDADLRVHIQPSPNSPSFLTLKENDKVDVLTHIRRPRTDLPRKPLVNPIAKKAKATRKPGKAAPYPPPPMPAPPLPPANWLELSKSDVPDEEAAEPENPAPAAPTDDWSLVRAPDGQSGWVLTRRLRPAIPDEVAQYAEGHRIVSYFSLGSVRDGDQQKDTWLWTTVGDGVRPYDFDSFRVFVWSTRRHRYETEYIERNLIGYSPVQLQPVRFSGKGRNAPAGEEYAGFSVCVEKKDGQRYRRQYAVMNTLVRYAGEEPCVLPPPVDFGNPGAVPAAATPAASQAPKESFTERVKRRLKALTGGWLGR
jgi:SH3-like domain-containing protein